MTFATGIHAVADTALAILHTHGYILDTRGIVKTGKAWAFAHDLANRTSPACPLPGDLSPCLIKNEGRDIGGHVDTTSRGTGTTTTRRPNLTTQEMYAILAAFSCAAQRVSLARGKINPKSTDSDDTTAISQNTLCKFTTAIARSIHRLPKEPAKQKALHYSHPDHTLAKK